MKQTHLRLLILVFFFNIVLIALLTNTLTKQTIRFKQVPLRLLLSLVDSSDKFIGVIVLLHLLLLGYFRNVERRIVVLERKVLLFVLD